MFHNRGNARRGQDTGCFLENFTDCVLPYLRQLVVPYTAVHLYHGFLRPLTQLARLIAQVDKLQSADNAAAEATRRATNEWQHAVATRVRQVVTGAPVTAMGTAFYEHTQPSARKNKRMTAFLCHHDTVGTAAQRGAIFLAFARDASCTFFRSAADSRDVGGGPLPKFGTGFARKVRGFTSFSKRRLCAASRFRSAASASRFMSPSKGPGAARARRFARNRRSSSSASSARTLFRSDRRARRRSAARRAASWYNAAAPLPRAFTVAFARRARSFVRLMAPGEGICSSSLS